MKYNVPYGLPDETTLYGTPYINGNPTTGTMGSIPPAASIEYDQREIVAVIQWAADHGYHDMAGALCANPTNADLQQLLKAIFGIVNANKLTAAQTYYVNAATGDDSNNGTTTGTAFKTIQRAVNQSSVYNLNGYNIYIYVADGTYGKVYLPNVNGTGYITIVGNQAIPGNCIIHANVGPAVLVAGSPYIMTGFRFESDSADSATGQPGAGIWQAGAQNFTLGAAGTAVEFGFCADSHIQCVIGALGIPGGTAVRLLGASSYHVYCANSGWVYCDATGGLPTLIIPTAITFNYFIRSSGSSNTNVFWASITGKTNVTSAVKYLADTNGIISSNGGGINYYPGPSAGVTSTGGQYL